MTQRWTLTVLPDPADSEGALLELPPDLIEAAGWKPGDVIKWVDNGDGSWTLEKAKRSKTRRLK